jgi:hypothetical protein
MSYNDIMQGVATKYEEGKYLTSCSCVHYKDETTCSDCGSINVEFDYEVKGLFNQSHIEEYYCLDCKSTEEIASYQSNIYGLAEIIARHQKGFDYTRYGSNGLYSEMCFKNELELQNVVLDKAHDLIKYPVIYNLNEDDINELKANVVFVFDEWASKQNKCPKDCKNIEYVEELICGELEHWACDDCGKSFNVSIEIVRDFKNKEVRK